MLTSDAFQTELALVRRVDRKPRDRGEVVLGVVRPDVHPFALVDRILPDREREPRRELRSPVPSQLTMKISGGPGSTRLEKTIRLPRGVIIGFT